MASIEPQPGRQEAGADIEKSHAIDNGVREVDEKHASDVDSEVYQPGVQRVRAVTSVWTKKTMIIMFCL